VGAGIFGIAAALELRARGHHVTVFEQGETPNERASSTDVSKTIRRIYGANGTYVELAERAGAQWRRWQDLLGESFYFQTGQLEIIRDFGPTDRVYQSWQFLTARGADVQVLAPPEARRRFPQFTIEPGEACVFDPWAGFVASGRAVAALASLARAEGITVRERTPILAVDEVATAAQVRWTSGTASFDRAIVAAGPWIARLMPQVGGQVRITRQQMAFFRPVDPRPFTPGSMPVWGINPDTDGWYGHPLLREGYVKVANDLREEDADPDVTREVSPAFLERAEAFVGQRIPGLTRGEIVGGRACLYANTPDRHFVIDYVSPRVLVAGGGSGHGFKFGGSIGPVIADALEERANPLGDLFRLKGRFAKPSPVGPGNPVTHAAGS
jgi:glycine/D-amino acid oxidase-like deaminating enzyme